MKGFIIYTNKETVIYSLCLIRRPGVWTFTSKIAKHAALAIDVAFEP